MGGMEMELNEKIPVFLDGQRLFLSPIRTIDAPKYVHWLNDSEIADNLLVPRPISLLKEEAAIEEMAKTDPGKSMVVGIWDKEPERLVGGIGLHGVDGRHQFAEVGIFIGEKELWGKGYGPEAMRLLMGYAFDTMNLRKITIRYFGSNSRAGKAYTKIGFKEIGRHKDHRFIAGEWWDEVIMEIFRDDFKR
jgi:RimJ/RimL family protein N-acetyltransferase